MDVLTDRLCVMLLLLMMNRLHHSHFNIFEIWLMADNVCQRHGSFSGVYAGLSIDSSRMKSTPLLYSLPWDCTRFRSTWPLERFSKPNIRLGSGKDRVENWIEIPVDTHAKIRFSKQKYDRPYDCPAPLLQQ